MNITIFGCTFKKCDYMKCGDIKMIKIVLFDTKLYHAELGTRNFSYLA